VDVVDGLLASAVVRGPLAEGEPVDMGTPAGVIGAKAGNDSEDISPDVQHNRQWLRALMARHQFDNLPNAWWHFAHQAAPQPAVAEVELAER
jgi:D-alanyl-D-alanine dipeptidase